MNTKHTPGPWEVDGSSICQAQGDRRVAWLTIPESEKRHEWEANARLIAASPCMLEAIADYLNPFACRQKTHEKLMAAFAKATGDEP